jgi:DNA repair photolyase
MVTRTAGTREFAVKNVNCSKGCSNDCTYCYSKSFGNHYGWKKRADWSNMENKDWMFNKKFKKAKNTNKDLFDVMFPSSHDITLSNIDLAIAVCKNILEPGNSLLIVSKADDDWIRYFLRPLYEYEEQILFRFTITTLDNRSKDFWETNAPSISSSLKALEFTYDTGLKTSVNIEPFLDDTVVNVVKRVHPYVTNDIWVGPMNMTHVPKEFVQELDQDQYYTPENLKRIKKEIDSLGFTNIRYKDHFLNKIKELI